MEFMTFTAHFKTEDSWSGIFLETKDSLCIAQCVLLQYSGTFCTLDARPVNLPHIAWAPSEQMPTHFSQGKSMVEK